MMYDDQRNSFLELPEDERSKILYDMLSYVRSEVAGIKKSILDFQDEQRSVRREREQRERERDDSLLNTTQKIAKALAKQFDFWVYLRDKVIPTILAVGLLVLLNTMYGK